MSLMRNFRLGGGKSLQFRLEAFNAVQQPGLGRPEHVDGEPDCTARINTTRTPMRELQIGVKFSF